MSLFRPRIARIIPKTIQSSPFTTSTQLQSVSDSLRTEAHRNNQKFKLENLFNVKDKGMYQFLS